MSEKFIIGYKNFLLHEKVLTWIASISLLFAFVILIMLGFNLLSDGGKYMIILATTILISFICVVFVLLSSLFRYYNHNR